MEERGPSEIVVVPIALVIVIKITNTPRLPQVGFLAILTPGPRCTLVPLICCSLAIAAAYFFINVVSQVLEAMSTLGKAVTFGTISATPCVMFFYDFDLLHYPLFFLPIHCYDDDYYYFVYMFIFYIAFQ